MGAGSPTTEQLTLLNYLETINDPAELTQELLTLIPPSSAQLTTLDTLDHVVGLVDVHLAEVRGVAIGVSAGDSWLEHDNAAWVRPFWNGGSQKPRNNLIGYKSNASGVAFGLDK